SIAIAVNSIDLAMVAGSVKIPVFAQHIDPVKYGGHTGHISPDLAKEVGAYGTLLNHAEYPIGNETLMKSIERAKDVGLFTVVCADTPEKGKEITRYSPDLIAVEPPELIGGDISVSKAGPHIIENAVKLIGENRVLVGAGIRDPEDVSIALSLGAVGVLLASVVIKAEDPYSVLMGLVRGLKG
ncbi:MAG: triose-phosphate isomerase, partial [Patescibacteria group bacterium]